MRTMFSVSQSARKSQSSSGPTSASSLAVSADVSTRTRDLEWKELTIAVLQILLRLLSLIVMDAVPSCLELLVIVLRDDRVTLIIVLRAIVALLLFADVATKDFVLVCGELDDFAARTTLHLLYSFSYSSSSDSCSDSSPFSEVAGEDGDE